MSAREPFTDPDEIVTLPDGTTKRFGDLTKAELASLIAAMRAKILKEVIDDETR